MPRENMKALSLFSGIGGLDLAAEWAGIETAAFCEIEPYAVNILKRRWPDVPILPDVREIDGRDWSVDVVHGGFPCQDLSVAGKQAGLSGERSGLWFEMLRIIGECRPAFALAENVRGAVNLALDTVCSGLGDEGYEVRPYVLPASAFGAPHQRERLFVVGVRADVADSLNERFQGGERGCSFLEQESPAHEPASERSKGSGSLWPTPQQRDYRSGDEPGGIRAQRKREQGWSPNLNDAVKAQVGDLWPTPRGNKPEGYSSEGFRPTLAQQVTGEPQPKCGQLNPAWVEILMGFPLGWTDVDCDEPEPWPGWPAPMNATQNWPTTRACDGIVRHSQNWMHKRVTENRDVDITTAVKTNVKTGQYPYEPPRTVTGCKNRAKRLKCLGNSVVPQQAYPIFRAIAEMEAMTP